MATRERKAFLVFLCALFCTVDCKKAKEKKTTEYIIPFNRTLEEELYSVKQTIMTVRQDLHDIMRDVKGLNKIFRNAENRLSELERIMEVSTERETESESGGSTQKPVAHALTSKDSTDNSNSSKSTSSGQGMAPKFLDKATLLEHVSVKEGGTASLRCPATGKPMPRIMWLKNQMLFARKQGMTEAIKWKLLLRNTMLKDSGNYTCYIKNRYGYIRHTFVLEVKEGSKTKSSTTTTTTTNPITTTPPSETKPKRKRKPADEQPAPAKPKLKPKYRKMGKTTKPTKAPPQNLMETDPTPMWMLPVAAGARGVTGQGEKCEAKIAAGNPPSRDCWDLKMYHCVDKSGLYNVTVDEKSYTVYCDMATDGGGWTVFQRRFNGNVNFNRDWESYKNGFGRLPDGEFWWGNENLYVFTRDRRMRLRVDMHDETNRTFVEYDGFWISEESDYYRMNVEGFRGLGGEAFLQPVWEEESHNNMMFSTKDRDRDGSLANCAAHFGGGWWFNDCYSANLNGVYPRGKSKKTPSLQWKPWKGAKTYLMGVEMKIRPSIAPSSINWDFWYPEKDDSFRIAEYYRIHGGCC